jgi:epoxyqueuosine reductase QueG
MNIHEEIEKELKSKGAEFIRFVDISHLPHEDRKGLPYAILIGKTLSPEYIQDLLANNTKENEFQIKEAMTDKMADDMAINLIKKGFSAYSQSDDNLALTGFYDKDNQNTPLPHKTIALLANLGWIGKHDLLITPEYGSAISMCTVLTDAPIETTNNTPISPRCGNCNICQDICTVDAIKGNIWTLDSSRDSMVDVVTCYTCQKCMAICPWTQKYTRKNL